MSNHFLDGFLTGQSIFNAPQGVFSDGGFELPPVDLSPVDLFQGPFPEAVPFATPGPAPQPFSAPVTGSIGSPGTGDIGLSDPSFEDATLGDFLGHVAMANPFGLPARMALALPTLALTNFQEANFNKALNLGTPLGKAKKIAKFFNLDLGLDSRNEAFDDFNQGLDDDFGEDVDGAPAGPTGNDDLDSGGFEGSDTSGFGVEGDEADNEAAAAEAEAAEGDDGDGGADGGGDKIICAELYRQGLLDHDLYMADERYGDRVPRDILDGYHLWANPVVRQMKRSHRFARFMAVLARPMTKEFAKREGFGNGSWIGKIMLAWGEPACGILGRVMGWQFGRQCLNS